MSLFFLLVVLIGSTLAPLYIVWRYASAEYIGPDEPWKYWDEQDPDESEFE